MRKSDDLVLWVKRLLIAHLAANLLLLSLETPTATILLGKATSSIGTRRSPIIYNLIDYLVQDFQQTPGERQRKTDIRREEGRNMEEAELDCKPLPPPSVQFTGNFMIFFVI